MTCDRCGRPTTNRRHCADCAREVRREERERLEGTDALHFEKRHICANCGGAGGEDDGAYLDDRPGVWMCDDCHPETGDSELVADGGTETIDGNALDATAGEVGIPVDAVCTGCNQTRVKRAPVNEIDTEAERGSFEHNCHRCCGVEWWNVLAVLDGLIDDGGAT